MSVSSCVSVSESSSVSASASSCVSVSASSCVSASASSCVRVSARQRCPESVCQCRLASALSCVILSALSCVTVVLCQPPSRPAAFLCRPHPLADGGGRRRRLTAVCVVTSPTRARGGSELPRPTAPGRDGSEPGRTHRDTPVAAD